ncbi:hypothetical protein AVEN_273439-1 [Araneus ventricosus]|uniref:Uncharacterized protein n=1 Tax=Araneus ventricosus TaxID=182803 RepID=A0A4Y2E2Z3_ARAVE|nr:hypothetical protein AVEN_273439-1 [Araneus ventricosus]
MCFFTKSYLLYNVAEASIAVLIALQPLVCDTEPVVKTVLRNHIWRQTVGCLCQVWISVLVDQIYSPASQCDKFSSRKLKQSEFIFLNAADFQNATGCQFLDVWFRIGQHCGQYIFRVSEVTILAFTFVSKYIVCSDEFELVLCAIFIARTNFVSKLGRNLSNLDVARITMRWFSEGNSIET